MSCLRLFYRDWDKFVVAEADLHPHDIPRVLTCLMVLYKTDNWQCLTKIIITLSFFVISDFTLKHGHEQYRATCILSRNASPLIHCCLWGACQLRGIQLYFQNNSCINCFCTSSIRNLAFKLEKQLKTFPLLWFTGICQTN